MKYSKLDLFAENLTVPTTQNTTTYGRVIDLRKGNFIDGLLKVYGQVVGAVNATGSVTTKVQTSADGLNWTDLVSMVQVGSRLIAMGLPIVDKKRFVRLAFSVGGTALGSAVTVKAGLVDEFDCETLPAVQSYPPLEDLATDAFGEPLELASNATSIAKNSNGTVAILKGAVTTIIPASDKHTVTIENGAVKVALAEDAATGNETLVDGLGNTVTLAVTATT